VAVATPEIKERVVVPWSEAEEEDWQSVVVAAEKLTLPVSEVLKLP
jgi:hypothetical protein